MRQNRSTAVMQRRAEPHDSLDDFPTPPWATRALLEFLDRTLLAEANMTCREPAANRGYMVRTLEEFFEAVEAADVHDYGAGFPVADYLFGPPPPPVDWTITNPPFRLAQQFIERALDTSRSGVAVLVRTSFLEGIGRCDELFLKTPPAFVLQFAERVVIHKGRLAPPDGSTATAYCWMIWHPRSTDTRLRWLAPCRERLERPEDFAEAAGGPAPIPLFKGCAE